MLQLKQLGHLTKHVSLFGAECPVQCQSSQTFSQRTHHLFRPLFLYDAGGWGVGRASCFLLSFFSQGFVLGWKRSFIWGFSLKNKRFLLFFFSPTLNHQQQNKRFYQFLRASHKVFWSHSLWLLLPDLPIFLNHPGFCPFATLKK